MIKDLKKICDAKTFEAVFNTYAKVLKRYIFLYNYDVLNEW